MSRYDLTTYDFLLFHDFWIMQRMERERKAFGIKYMPRAIFLLS